MKSVLAGGSCTAAILAFSLAAYAQTTGQTPTSGQSGSQPSSATQQTDSAAQQVTVVGCVQREGDYRRAQGAGHGGAVGTGVGAGNEFVLINASHSSASSTTGSDTQAGTATSGTATGSTSGTTGSSTGTTGTTSGTATTAPGTAGGMPSTSGSPSATAGTAGSAGAAKAFELTGAGEGQLTQYVGKRVEISGRVKSGHSAHSASGSTTGSTSGTTTGTQSGTATGTQSGSTTGSSAGERVAGATKGGSDIMGQDLNLPELEVVSVREASGSCPAGQDQNPR